LDPRNPAAWPREAAVLFLGPGEDDTRRRSGKTLKIMGGLTDAPFLRRQAHKGAVAAAEPRNEVRSLRPAPLIQTGQNDNIGGQQPGVERLPQEKARMGVFERWLALCQDSLLKQTGIAGQIECEGGRASLLKAAQNRDFALLRQSIRKAEACKA